ncbi:hypothetical protein IWW36_000726 [Coemansia brasiliensis]|uniref:J domain-containing protein n=1 Tax=Coemansia brasiliensis TaxID=2650707 RepID=A0A9W8II74_9FUNG|nr:hypothetical protein IWW36_000726 [Coemansia brasiliensis]
MLERYFPPAEITTSLDSFALGWLYPYAMHWKTPLALATAYTLFVMRANPQKSIPGKTPSLSRAQTPMFKRLVIAHNIALAGFSLWTLLSMTQGLIDNLRTYGWYEGICDLRFTMWNDKLFRLSYYFYLSKYYEFIDTLIILYKGRRASVLQMYHHAGAVITMWAGCYYIAVPIAFFVITNSAIHTWMYTFYALTAAGIRPPGKQLLTSSQIFQFLFGISCCLFYLLCPVLGISSSATPSEIKSAFYKCSMKWHPDRNQGSEEAHKRFLKISEAYSILSDEQKRRAYDRTVQIRTGNSFTGSRAGHPHSSAFSSSGEYSSARRTSRTYQRPESTYARHSGRSRVKSNFEEWERQHYGAMKARADNIGKHAKESASNAKYSSSQVTMFQLGEFCVVFTVVFGIGWSLSGFVRVRNGDSPAQTIQD